VWHRRGVQPTIPAAGTNRRLTVCGSVEARGRGRVEVICPAQDSACFALYLAALDARHVATGKEVYLVLDNGPCHKSTVTKAALAARSTWLHVLWLAPYSPQLNPKEREWKRLKRDARSHLAPTLRAFVDEIAAGLRHLGGDRLDIVDRKRQDSERKRTVAHVSLWLPLSSITYAACNTAHTAPHRSWNRWR